MRTVNDSFLWLVRQMLKAILVVRILESTYCDLRKNLMNDSTVHIGQSEVSSRVTVAESCVVES
jgi:hypothetical protein